MAENMNPDVPSDVVELIIAVDLNPSDPEEPINVNDVQVRDKGAGGEDGGEDWKGLVAQLLMGDPNSGITSDKFSYEEAKDAVASVLDGGEGEGADPFSRAVMGDPGKPEPPSVPKKKGGGMKAALDRALGGKPDKPMDEDEDEDEKDEDKGNPFAKRG